MVVKQRRGRLHPVAAGGHLATEMPRASVVCAAKEGLHKVVVRQNIPSPSRKAKPDAAFWGTLLTSSRTNWFASDRNGGAEWSYLS